MASTTLSSQATITSKKTAVLFDMDGTVMNSHKAWDLALDDIAMDYRGSKLTPEESAKQWAWSMDECQEFLFPTMSKSEFLKRVDVLFAKYAHTACMLPGALEMVAEAARLTDGRVALVTNAPFFSVKHILNGLPAFKKAFRDGECVFCAFDPIPTPVPVNAATGQPAIPGEELPSCSSNSGSDSDSELAIPSKPSPVMLFLAAAKLGVRPSDCIMIGDGINDIRAGNRCGATTIAINWPSVVEMGHMSPTMPEAAFNTSSLEEAKAVMIKLLSRCPSETVNSD